MSGAKSSAAKKSPSKNGDALWYAAFVAITVIGFGTRLYKIDEPDHVCWDETHFGKMGSWYINRTFFFDVHPPLGKMLIGLAGKLTGYNGTFPFGKPGDKYMDHPYVGMRLFCVTLGALVIPFSFIITWDLTKSVSAAFLGAAIITFDVGHVTLAQYILLDPILLCFIVGSFVGSVRLSTLHPKAFSLTWWFWMTWTGLFLASAVSVKFVGLFIVVVVGLQTITDLWNILGNLNTALSVVVKHFISRVVCLILLPIITYLFFFWIHLRVLSKSGSGDGFFSSAFQSQLEGNTLYNASMPRLVAYGAVITLKSDKTGGGYLHSHWHLYPEGVSARQQQVTGYSHKDENNRWMIKKYEGQPNSESDPIEIVKNGDLVRLEHVVTTRNLHSHREQAPITKRHFQVTCYGENGTGDANDVWRVELLDGAEGEEVKTVTSKIKFVHYFVKCALHCHSKQLPKWGFEQMEVTCNPNTLDKTNLWNIEDNSFARLPNVSFKVYAPSFLEKVLESHAVMFQGNAGLKPKEGEVTSRPWQWPINLRGQFFSGNTYKIYLLGNPIIWWGNVALLVAYLMVQVYIAVRKQRGCALDPEIAASNDRFTNAAVWLFIAWFLHYVPFFAMGRVLYYHHYFPASVFSSLLSAVLIDYFLKVALRLFVRDNASAVFHSCYAILLASLAYSFVIFSPLAYGIQSDPQNEASNTTMDHLKWLDSWEF